MSLIDAVSEALTTVQDPELHRSITDLGMVEDLSEINGAVSIKVLLTISGCPMQDRLRSDITKAIMNVEGAKTVDLTFGVMSQEQRDNVKKVVRNGRKKLFLLRNQNL